MQSSMKYFKGLKLSNLKDDDNKKAEILDLQWNSPGTKLAFSKTTNNVSVVDLRQATVTDTAILRNCHDRPVESISWDPLHDNVLVTAGSDSTLREWNVATKKLENSYKVPGRAKLVKHSANGRYIFCMSKSDNEETNSAEYHVTVLDRTQGSQIVCQESFDLVIYCLASGNHPDIVAAGFENGEVKVYDVSAPPGLSLVHTFKASVSTVNWLSYDPKGRYLLSGSHEGIISIWDLKTLSCVRTIANVDEPVMRLDVSYDGSYVCASFQDGSECKIYDVVSGAEFWEIKNTKSWNYITSKVAFRPKHTSYAFTQQGEVVLAHKPESGLKKY